MCVLSLFLSIHRAIQEHGCHECQPQEDGLTGAALTHRCCCCALLGSVHNLIDGQRKALEEAKKKEEEVTITLDAPGPTPGAADKDNDKPKIHLSLTPPESDESDSESTQFEVKPKENDEKDEKQPEPEPQPGVADEKDSEAAKREAKCVADLLKMGFPLDQCQKAAELTHNVQDAAEWIVQGCPALPYPEVVDQLTAMGYAPGMAKRALFYTQSESIEEALEWLEDPASYDEPPPPPPM